MLVGCFSLRRAKTTDKKGNAMLVCPTVPSVPPVGELKALSRISARSLWLLFVLVPGYSVAPGPSPAKRNLRNLAIVLEYRSLVCLFLHCISPPFEMGVGTLTPNPETGVQ